jgi:type IV secretory pathway TrbF-like protein
MIREKLRPEYDPNLSANRPWDYQVEQAYKALVFWRSATVLSLALMLILFLFTIYHISAPKYIPYVVEMTDGQVRFAGMLANQRITLNDALIRNSLMNFISKSRIVSTDIVATKRSVSDAYFLATNQAQKLLLVTAQEAVELSEQGNIHKDVIFEVFEAIGEQNWRVQWREDTRTEGLLTSQKRYSGIFSFIQENPATPIAAEKNPAGFYITGFTIQEVR